MSSLQADDDLLKRLVTDNQGGIIDVCQAVRRTSQATASPRPGLGLCGV
jgi:hypothetical protein